jgi:hypothetical protein
MTCKRSEENVYLFKLIDRYKQEISMYILCVHNVTSNILFGGISPNHAPLSV